MTLNMSREKCHLRKKFFYPRFLLVISDSALLLQSLFPVVINTECEGVWYRIYARQKFQIMPEREGIIKEFLPGVYPVTNARA